MIHLCFLPPQNGLEMKREDWKIWHLFRGHFSKPIIDETGINENTICLSLGIPKPNACMEELEKIGFTLTDGKGR